MSVEETKFHGVWVAMVTPWDMGHHTPRRSVLERLIDRFSAAGVSGLFILGTTGEGALLSPEERMLFAEIVLEMTAGKLPVIVHTGHEQTATVAELSMHASRIGAAGAAVSPPTYYHLDEEELTTHFLTVAEAVNNFPIFLYDVPSVTGTPLSGELLIALRNSRRNIKGAKVSRTDWEGWRGYLAYVDEVTLFVGADSMCLSTLFMGVHGIVSGPANVLPTSYVKLYRAVEQGDLIEARRQQRLIDQLSQACHYGKPLAFIKEGVDFLGWSVGSVLAPLRSLHPEERETLHAKLINLANIAEG